MPTIRTYSVRPILPPALQPLDTIARNLWWCWNSAANALFQHLDRDLWEAVDHNPLALLSRISQSQLEAAANDDGFLSHLDGVAIALKSYLETTNTWFSRSSAAGTIVEGSTIPALRYPEQRVGYFSAEIGLTESVPIYSGGLGILAGDHLKSASDLGLPLVGVSLLYREAFHQYLNVDGWQQEIHPETDLTLLPIQLQKDAKGNPIVIQCDLPGRTLSAHVWRLDVGRVPVLLLDSNLPQNTPEDQRITDRLYGGDLDMRIRQEILLGIGGLRALRTLGFDPAVCHMNEGHSAFLALERVRALIKERGLNFAQACDLACAGNAFTTHTPVPAGNDRFPPEMIDNYFSGWYAQLGAKRDEVLALGRETTDPNETFCMTVLALKLAAKSNGVSKLHGGVSRNMWKRVYPDVPQQEIPIGSITNGIHQRSFLSDDMRRLFDTYLGPKWVSEPDEAGTWERIDRIPAEEFWRAHERSRERLIGFARTRLAKQLDRRGAGNRAVADAAEVLDPKALTIGFARRFAAYKRATLVLRDPDRLSKILNNAQRPVQLLFAGKAHQKDDPGKEIIRNVVHLASQPEMRHRIVFIEDYDINVARQLVQGVDVWLNTPVRPLEASGTSGMKAVVNGAIHCSILDGWWAEAYARDLGWAIGEAEEYQDRDLGEKIESDMLYHLLESEIIPMFYERGRDGLPRDWIDLMKRSIRTLAPVFNTHRMVHEYCAQVYEPVARRYARLSGQNGARVKALTEYRQKILRFWDRVVVQNVDAGQTDVSVGEPLKVKAQIALGELSPADVEVQVYAGAVDSRGEMIDGHATTMTAAGSPSGGAWSYSGELISRQSGRFGYSVRVIPHNEDLASPFGIVPVRWG